MEMCSNRNFSHIIIIGNYWLYYTPNRLYYYFYKEH
mgnify:CR=1 FL=1